MSEAAWWALGYILSGLGVIGILSVIRASTRRRMGLDKPVYRSVFFHHFRGVWVIRETQGMRERWIKGGFYTYDTAQDALYDDHEWEPWVEHTV